MDLDNLNGDKHIQIMRAEILLPTQEAAQCSGKELNLLIDIDGVKLATVVNNLFA